MGEKAWEGERKPTTREKVDCEMWNERKYSHAFHEIWPHPTKTHEHIFCLKEIN